MFFYFPEGFFYPDPYKLWQNKGYYRPANSSVAVRQYQTGSLINISEAIKHHLQFLSIFNILKEDLLLCKFFYCPLCNKK
jgi:hypothetical protein